MGRERPAMREESHLDDMRTAIRGDFDRLADRRGEQELMRVSAAEVEPAPESELVEAHVGEEPVRRSWLARLAGLSRQV